MCRFYDRESNPIELDQRIMNLKDNKYRSIDRTWFDDNTHVSTIRLWLDHNFWEGDPLIFETMVFSDHKTINQMQERYSTLEQAKTWHKETCEYVRNFLSANE